MKYLWLMVVPLMMACSPKGNLPTDAQHAEECIATEALRGSNVATIALTCGVPIAQVIMDLVNTKDPAVKGTPARLEAHRTLQKLRGERPTEPTLGEGAP